MPTISQVYCNCKENSIPCIECQREFMDREKLAFLTQEQCDERGIDYAAYKIAYESQESSELDDYLWSDEDLNTILDNDEQEFLMSSKDRIEKENEDMEIWADEAIESFYQEEITMSATTMTVKEVSELSGKNEREIRRLCADGKLEAHKDGRKWVISSKSVEAFFGIKEDEAQEEIEEAAIEGQDKFEAPVVYQPCEIIPVAKHTISKQPTVIVEVDKQRPTTAVIDADKYCAVVLARKMSQQQQIERNISRRLITGEVFCRAMALQSVQQVQKPKVKPYRNRVVAAALCIGLFLLI